MSPDLSVPATLGAILAGGLARRLGGGDKALRTVGGHTVLNRIAGRMAEQVTRLIINANDDPRRFETEGLPVAADTLPDRPGPLAGVLAALEWASRTETHVEWVVTVPGDAPFLPRDLVRRLHEVRRDSNASVACAASDGRTHPVVALWPMSIRDALHHAVAEQGIRRIDAFTRSYAVALAEWPTVPVDPFFNVNTPEDLAEADRLANTHPAL